SPRGNMQADDTSGYKYAFDADGCSHCSKHTREHNLRKVSNYRYCPSCLIKRIEAGLIHECYNAFNQLITVVMGSVSLDTHKKYENVYYHNEALQLHGLIYNEASGAVESLEGNDAFARCSITNDFVAKDIMLEIDSQWYSVIPEDKLDKYINTMTGHLYKRKPQTQGVHILTCRELFIHLAKTFTSPIQPLEVAALYPGMSEKMRFILLKSIKPEVKKDTGYDLLSLAA
ncbi:hypothetical protein KAT92_06815, partial [Candidatus Babeliales bacterium]|nr:hypothetical protein [Candidatus Babeliales bacterium]